MPEPAPDDVAALRARLLAGAPSRHVVHARPTPAVRWTTTRRALAVGTAALALLTAGLVARGVAGAPSEAVPMPARMVTSGGPQGDVGGVETAPPGPAATEVPGGDDAEPADVLVHVVGAVERPGVVRLAPGGRVLDAVEEAGGASADADLARLNLARVVADGEQVVVLREGEEAPEVAPDQGGGEPAGDGTDQGGGRLDLNRATAAELEALPGIGPVLSQRIVEHRDAYGPFASVDALLEVSGVGPAVLERLRPGVKV